MKDMLKKQVFEKVIFSICSNTVPLSYMFSRRTGRSLTLVQRLKLEHKMEYHDGCVNALHFNKSGQLFF